MRFIRRNQLICRGSPTVEGTRLTVFNVVTRTALEDAVATADDLALSLQQLSACLRYCADLSCVVDRDELPFCDGCKLADLPSPQIAGREKDFVVTGDPLTLGLSVSAEDYENDLSLTWLIAAEQIAKLPAIPDL